MLVALRLSPAKYRNKKRRFALLSRHVGPLLTDTMNLAGSAAPLPVMVIAEMLGVEDVDSHIQSMVN